jgi:hypothetical protein
LDCRKNRLARCGGRGLQNHVRTEVPSLHALGRRLLSLRAANVSYLSAEALRKISAGHNIWQGPDRKPGIHARWDGKSHMSGIKSDVDLRKLLNRKRSDSSGLMAGRQES